MLMEVALDAAARVPQHDEDNTDDDTIRTSNSDAAGKFLAEFTTARIVVIIDTHSLDNGAFAWKGNSPATYEGCDLESVSATHHCPTLPNPLQILSDCIPPNIYSYISDDSDTPDHSHRSLIVNLSCGASVTVDMRRHELLKGWV